jgi:hypothetical protein
VGGFGRRKEPYLKSFDLGRKIQHQATTLLPYQIRTIRNNDLILNLSGYWKMP